MPPYQGGGGMIDEVKKKKITFCRKSYKNLKPASMQTAEVVAFSESIKLIEKIGLTKYLKLKTKS